MSSLANSHVNLFLACEEGDLQTIQSHLHSSSSSQISSIRDPHQATLIHYICRYGHLNLLKYFLEDKHLDPSGLRTTHGATCLHDASVCDQVHIVEYILHLKQENFSTKFRWTIRDEQGNTPLHLAAKYNCLKVLDYLLNDEVADPHIRSYHGYQPIHYACEQGHIQSVKILLSKSPDVVNEQTNQLLTPLHFACKCGSLETLQILIGHGGNIHLRDEHGANVLHFACKHSHFHLVQFLIEKQSAHINEIDYRNFTPLHYSCITANEHLVCYLLDRNAQILRDQFGNSPLHVAAEKGHQNICAILIERAFCQLSEVNHHRLTAADLADHGGFPSLANQLRLRANSLIQIPKASIVRLVIKKRNVPRADAANQVNEEDFLENKNDISTSTLYQSSPNQFR